jgi:glycosyltransferase involved in cell wall biosynthesis
MLVSIITATYNSAPTLGHCIQSVLGQSYQDIEHIIIDNCSTDGTLDIAKSFSDEISRIVSEPDKGIYDALNKGIQLAQGGIIGILHADDFYASANTIALVAEQFKNKDIDAVYGNLQYVDKKTGTKVIRNWVSGKFTEDKLKNGWMPPHPTLFIKKSCYREFGLFDLDYKIAADYELMLRFLFRHKIKMAYVPEVLVRMRTGGTSNRGIRNIQRKSTEDLRAMKQYQLGGIFTLLKKNVRKIGQFF